MAQILILEVNFKSTHTSVIRVAQYLGLISRNRRCPQPPWPAHSNQTRLGTPRQKLGIPTRRPHLDAWILLVELEREGQHRAGSRS